MFKRMVRRGLPTHAVLSRVSRNLSFLKSNWENLQKATGSSEKRLKTKTKKYTRDLQEAIKFFGGA